MFSTRVSRMFSNYRTVLIYDIKTKLVSTGPADEPVEEANTILWCAVSSKRHSPFDNNLALACGRTVHRIKYANLMSANWPVWTLKCKYSAQKHSFRAAVIHSSSKDRQLFTAMHKWWNLSELLQQNLYRWRAYSSVYLYAACSQLTRSLYRDEDTCPVCEKDLFSQWYTCTTETTQVQRSLILSLPCFMCCHSENNK